LFFLLNFLAHFHLSQAFRPIRLRA
jgi:hypothetical protein